MGGLRVLPESFPLVLGVQAAADLQLRRHRDRVQPGEPQPERRAGPGPPDAGTPAGEPPAPGTAVVTDKGLSGQETEEFFAGRDLGLTLIRPARKDEKQPRPFPNWFRQRVEAVIWTLKNQLGLERHGDRLPAGLHHPAAARAQRGHLAQLAHRRPRQALPDRLRPRVTCPHFPINDLVFREFSRSSNDQTAQ
jgi:hypothetical protein